MHLSRKARKKFKEAVKNDEELGELLLFCFLEGHLDAPKILTKLELKASNQLYVNGSDRVHLKKLSDKKYQLIFGESKTYDDAFSIFIGYKIDVKDKQQKCSNDEFPIEIEGKINPKIWFNRIHFLCIYNAFY